MSISAEIRGPFPFSRRDLEASRLIEDVRHILAHFRHWRNTNPGKVSDHVDQYTAQLAAIASRHRLLAVHHRPPYPPR